MNTALFHRRNILAAMGVGAVAAGGYNILARANFGEAEGDFALTPADQSGRALASWRHAFGFTLIPLLSDHQFALWDQIWEQLPPEKEKWLEKFQAAVTAPLIQASLPLFEAAIVRMLVKPGNAEPLNAFITQLYDVACMYDEFVMHVFYQGTYRIGEADPRVLAEWGVSVEDYPGA